MPPPLPLSPPAPVLKLAPGDQDALRCKAVLFIESGNLEEALKLAGQPPLAASMAFEKVRAPAARCTAVVGAGWQWRRVSKQAQPASCSCMLV